MFIGHFAPAMAAAAHKDAPSLPVLFVAAQLVDWAFFALLLTGHEAMRVTPGISVMNPMDLYHMPWTHSLAGSIAFAAAFGIAISLITKNRAAAIIGFGVVLSHWFLDLLVHVPDLTLAGSEPKLGLGLWNHPMIEMPLEIAITFGALWFYVRKRGGSKVAIATLVVVLAALQAVNWFGPVESEVTNGTSFLAFFAYSVATLAAWWVARSANSG